MKYSFKISVLLFMATQLFSCFGYGVKSNSYPYSNFLEAKLESSESGWKKLRIFYDEPPLSIRYEEVATVIITGTESAKEPELLSLMQQEPGKYSADAIVYIETREILREKVNGFLLAAILFAAFNTPVEECEEEEVSDISSSEEYYALEVEGIAIKFIED